MEKNSLNNIICHLSWLEKLSPTHTHPLISICEFWKPYESLFFEFEFWPTPPHPYMTHSTPPHPFMTHPPHPTPPLVHFWAQRSLFSWAASLCLPLGRQKYLQFAVCNVFQYLVDTAVFFKPAPPWSTVEISLVSKFMSSTSIAESLDNSNKPSKSISELLTSKICTWDGSWVIKILSQMKYPN